MPKAAAGHFRDLHALSGHHRAEYERGLVADAAGRVLIGLNAFDRAEVKRFARVAHGHGKLQRLLPVHAAKQDSHQKRRHLIVGDLALRIAVNYEFYLLRAELFTLALFYDNISHQHS